jgi:hypothetical protein
VPIVVAVGFGEGELLPALLTLEFVSRHFVAPLESVKGRSCDCTPYNAEAPVLLLLRRNRVRIIGYEISRKTTPYGESANRVRDEVRERRVFAGLRPVFPSLLIQCRQRNVCWRAISRLGHIDRSDLRQFFRDRGRCNRREFDGSYSEIAKGQFFTIAVFDDLGHPIAARATK